jgi:multidrug resistance protein
MTTMKHAARTSTKATAAVVAAVYFALLVDTLLYGAVVPVLPLYARDLGASPTLVGVLFGAYAAGLLAATPVLGAISDRVGRRRPLLAGSFGLAGATVLFAVADSVELLLAGRFVQGVAAAAVWTAGFALIADLVPATSVAKAMGGAMASTSAGLMLGPPIGGLLLEAGGVHAPFLATAALAATSGLLMAVLVVDRGGTTSPAPLRQLLRSRVLLTTAACVALASAALSMLEPVLPLDLADRLGAGAAGIGLVFGIATLAHGVASPAAGAVADRRPAMPVMAGGLIAMGVVVPLVAVAGSLPGTTVVLAGFAIAYSFVVVPALAALAPLAGAVNRLGSVGYATVYAAFNLAYGAGMVLGPLAAGAATSAIGLRPALAAAGAVLCCAGLLLLLGHYSAAPGSAGGDREGILPWDEYDSLRGRSALR